MTAVLELRNISKHFGATRALSEVDLTVERGEVHALLGENGCGKSTLVKILAGVHAPEDGGRLVVAGADVPLPMEPGTSSDIGLSFVHQDLGLVNSLTVMENLLGGPLGSRASSRWRIRWGREADDAESMLRTYGVTVDPRAVVNELPSVDQALVAIVRAAEQLKQHRERTDATSSVLVLDEPTVFLPKEEVSLLFDLIRSVVASGSSVIFISHDLPAVRKIADRVTVLRGGQVAATAKMSEVTDEQIVEFIVGSAPPASLVQPNAQTAHQPFDRGARSGLHVSGLFGGRVRDFSLDVAPGEIVGLAGLMGSGAEDIPYLMFGAQRAVSGDLILDGRPVNLAHHQPAAAMSMGIALIPADRRRDAIAPAVSVAENMMLLVLPRFLRRGRLQNAGLRDTADERAQQLDIRPRNTSVPVGTLSGGNAQKVVIAKWLEIQPRVLLLHEPTQGVDVAARAEIYRVIEEAATTGMSVVWVSSDFDELALVCHRVVIVGDGMSTGQVDSTQMTPEAITAGVYSGARPSNEGPISVEEEWRCTRLRQ